MIENGDIATVGKLALLNASFVKLNVPLVNKATLNLEKVSEEKYFSGNDYLRYYIITDEEPDDDDIVIVYSGNEYNITFLNLVKNREKKTIKKIYSISNSIVGRIHKEYRDIILKGGIEYFRFTKINGKYAGFPPVNKARISTEDARERWDFIFQHVLMIENNPQTKRKIGLLFGGIQNVDLVSGETITTLKQYSTWLKNKE